MLSSDEYFLSIFVQMEDCAFESDHSHLLEESLNRLIPARKMCFRVIMEIYGDVSSFSLIH